MQRQVDMPVEGWCGASRQLGIIVKVEGPFMSFSSMPCSTEISVFVGQLEADWPSRDRPKE